MNKVQVIDMATGEVKAERPGFMLLPPAEGKCRICAVAHEPDQAHNASSLFYGMRFKMRYGRDGTWADAVAHCPPATRELWEQVLRRRGRWTEPPAGVALIAEPIDG
jgi:hypothetical protein